MTGKKQIQEKIRLAVAGAIANGNGSITEELLKDELDKYFGENGYELIDKEDDSWDVKVGEVIENVKKSGAITGGGAGNNAITLTATDVATESRAAIIEVTVDGVDIPTVTDEEKLNWLKTLSTDELKEIYAQAQYGIGETWAGHFTGAPFSDVKGYYEYGPKNSGAFTDEYDYMIKTSSINNSNLNSLYFTAKDIDLPSKVTVSYNGENSIIDFIMKTKAEFVVTKNGSYTVTASNDDGEKGSTSINVTQCVNRSDNKEEEYSSIQESNQKITKDGYEVWIPAGFAYGTSANVGTVTKGLVITDSIEEVNGKKYSNGNEFVWIPVDKDNLTVGKTSRKMAEISSGTDYRGVLYNWSSDNTGSTPIAYSSNGYREPDVVSSYDGGSSDTVGITKTGMQKDYNDMIASIQEYGGFYVARYELGKDAISKLAVEPTSAEENNTKTWYGLYTKAKSYTNSKNSVTAQMIWGSQYDAMLQFGLTSSDSSKVNARTNGNHIGKALKTGTHKGADSINNIFDLEGNMCEWTQEASYTGCRVDRGGVFLTGNGGSPSDRSNDFSGSTPSSGGSRLGLYIK